MLLGALHLRTSKLFSLRAKRKFYNCSPFLGQNGRKTATTTAPPAKLAPTHAPARPPRAMVAAKRGLKVAKHNTRRLITTAAVWGSPSCNQDSPTNTNMTQKALFWGSRQTQTTAKIAKMCVRLHIWAC